MTAVRNLVRALGWTLLVGSPLVFAVSIVVSVQVYPRLLADPRSLTMVVVGSLAPFLAYTALGGGLVLLADLHRRLAAGATP